MESLSGSGQGAGQRMERKSGGGWLVIFSLPFLGAGIFMLLTVLGVSGVSMDEDLPMVVMLLLGILFSGARIALMFGRAGVTVDRGEMKVTKWWGLLVPMKVTRYDLSGYDRITVGKESRSDPNSWQRVYPVCLAGGPEVEEIEFDAPTDYPAARRLSEELARFLGHEIEDTTSGRTVRRRV